MATVNWNGGTLGAWSAPLNWEPPGLPRSTDDVIINAGTVPVTVTEDVSDTIDSLTLSGTAGFFPTLSFDGTTSLIAASSVTNAGTIVLSTGQLLTSDSLLNSNIISLQGGSLFTSAQDDGLIRGFGTLDASIKGTGTVDAADGILTLNGPVTTADVTFQIENTGTLQVDDLTNPSTVFQFRGTSGDLVVNPDFKGVIANMNVGTSADMPTTRLDVRAAVSSGTIDGTSLKLFNGTSLVATAKLANSYAASTQVIVGSGPNDTTAIFFSNAAPCYAAGTRILTDHGEKAVEDLSEGDMVIVLTDHGQMPRPVTWIGYREVNLARHPRPDLAAPIRIRRHAMGPDQPHRDLLVSPDHCLFVDGKLIPALMLVNDMTIVQERDRTGVLYFHVELERHGILLAEGLPAESYLDTGNRAMFANTGLAMLLHPEFRINDSLRTWKDDACAPLAADPPALQPIWQRFADRAEQLGFTPRQVRTHTDADLRVMVAGKAIDPIEHIPGRYVFVLPAGTGAITLASRATCPADITRYLDDRRDLGVAVASIALSTKHDHVVFAADHLPVGQGWHAAEAADGRRWRWTNGAGELRFDPLPEAAIMEIRLGGAASYIIEEIPARIAA